LDAEEDDKDMIVMYHKFDYKLNGNKEQIDSKWFALATIKPIPQWQKP
jgi:hypothetical protein